MAVLLVTGLSSRLIASHGLRDVVAGHEAGWSEFRELHHIRPYQLPHAEFRLPLLVGRHDSSADAERTATLLGLDPAELLLLPMFWFLVVTELPGQL